MTGILIYLYKKESTAFPDCKKSELSTKVVCVVSRRAPFRILFLCATHFSLLARIKHGVPSWKTPTSLQHFPTVLMRWLISVPFCSVFHFLLVFFFIKWTGIGQLLYMQRWTVLRPNWFHFLIFCNGLLLNISLYWYIKSDWKLPSCVLFHFLIQNIKYHTCTAQRENVCVIEDL